MCLKLAFLFEGGAQGLQFSDTTSIIKYDRAKLLDSKTVVEAALTAVNWARCNLSTAKVKLYYHYNSSTDCFLMIGSSGAWRDSL